MEYKEVLHRAVSSAVSISFSFLEKFSLPGPTQKRWLPMDASVPDEEPQMINLYSKSYLQTPHQLIFHN